MPPTGWYFFLVPLFFCDLLTRRSPSVENERSTDKTVMKMDIEEISMEVEMRGILLCNRDKREEDVVIQCPEVIFKRCE